MLYWVIFICFQYNFRFKHFRSIKKYTKVTWAKRFLQLTFTTYILQLFMAKTTIKWTFPVFETITSWEENCCLLWSSRFTQMLFFYWRIGKIWSSNLESECRCEFKHHAENQSLEFLKKCPKLLDFLLECVYSCQVWTV